MASPYVTVCCCFLIVALGISIPGTLGANVEPCPIGWVTYQHEVPNTCLYVSDTTADSLTDANAECLEKNASLIVIQSEEKMKFFRAIVKKYLSTSTKIWIGIQKSSSGQVTWLTKDGKIPAVSLPIGMQFSNWDYYGNYGSTGLVYKDGTLYRYDQMSRYQRTGSRYICEKRTACSKGWFGLACDKQCHCHGQVCETTALEVTCQYGCQVGWMGQDCSQAKQDADVRYFCVDSQDLGKYAHLRIDTKGVDYEHIYALDDDSQSVPWCNNTFIQTNKRMSTVTIKLFTDNATDKAINDGLCAGKIGENDKYEWQIKIQEKENIVSRNDQEVHIECDFSKADTFQLSGDTDIKHERWFRRSNIKKPVQNLKEKREKVSLLVVDPSTGKKLSETQIGSPISLRIDYALGDDSVVTGVRPYNCDASAPRGEQKVRFLDVNSCPIQGLPISKFSRNGTRNSLITNPFPLFGFDGTDEVDFHCSYVPCFGYETCLTDCDEDVTTIQPQNKNVTTLSRSRRSAEAVPHLIRGTVRIARYV